MTGELRVDLVVVVLPTTRLEESVRFYGDAIGLRLIDEWSDLVRGALFQASDTAHLELVEMADVQEAPEPRTTIGLQIRDVDEVHERLQAFGAKIKAPPTTRESCMASALSTRTGFQSTSTSPPPATRIAAPDSGGARWRTRT